MDQFDKLKKRYGRFVHTDPMRNGLHYPVVLAKLEERCPPFPKSVIDEGCGDGALLRRIVKKYSVRAAGFDSAPEQIAVAEEKEREKPLGIKYAHVTAEKMRVSVYFDAAVSVMVLPYAKNETGLQNFFNAASRSIRSGAPFVSVVTNPDFTAFGQQIGNRIFLREKRNGVEVQFLHPRTSKLQFSSHLTQHSKPTYERVAAECGFVNPAWVDLNPTSEFVAKHGAKFWEKCRTEQPYSLLTLEKS